MGIEIRVFLVIDAFSRFSGTLIACSAGLFLQLAKQLLDSTAAASGRGRASVGAGVTAGPWRRLGKASLTPRITRFLVPANSPLRPALRMTGRRSIWSLSVRLQFALNPCIRLSSTRFQCDSRA